MKKLTIWALPVVLLVLSSCQKEICYECKKGSAGTLITEKRCDSKNEAKDFKKDMESQGYTCEEVD
jgi:hypothetical protein